MKVLNPKDTEPTPDRQHICHKCNTHFEFNKEEARTSCIGLMIKCPVCNHESSSHEWSPV